MKNIQVKESLPLSRTLGNDYTRRRIMQLYPLEDNRSESYGQKTLMQQVQQIQQIKDMDEELLQSPLIQKALMKYNKFIDIISEEDKLELNQYISKTLNQSLSSIPEQTKETEGETIQGFGLMDFIKKTVSTHPIPSILLLTTLVVVAIERGIAEYHRETLPAQHIQFNSNLSNADKLLLRTELLNMPFVQKLQSNEIFTRMNPVPKKKWRRRIVASNWIDGIPMNNKITPIPATSPKKHDDTKIKDNTFKRELTKAERFVKMITENAILSLFSAPQVHVHLENSTDYRASYHNNIIDVAQDDDSSIIAHETGHYLEDKMSSTALPYSWGPYDLLIARNNGSRRAGYIYPFNYEEQRFQGNYPATGPYTSKYYTDGSTEITSMSLQYLSDPNSFMKLINNDPLQAAIILRMLRPTEFQATIAQNAQNLLP